MIDPTLAAGFTATLETLCNQALAYDPGSRQSLAKLHGCILAVESTVPAVVFYIAPQPDGSLSLMSHYEGAVTTRLRGQLANLLSLAFNGGSNSLSQHNVTVIGSTSLLVALQGIFKQLDIDWEDALNQQLGDTLGHPLAEGLRHAFGYLSARAKSTQRLTAEYIQEELRRLPSRPELEDYYRQVDALRLAGDRAEARLQQLQQRLTSTPKPTPSSDQ